MSARRVLALSVAMSALLLTGCASSAFGGSISGSGAALSPEERRLQAVESKAAELARRLDSANLAALDQENQRLRDDIRSLRGEVERLRYDFDQQQKRLQGQYAELDRRIQRLESPLGMQQGGYPGAASGATTTVPSVTPGTMVTVTPPPATAPSNPGTSPSGAAPGSSYPTTPLASPPGAASAPSAGGPVVISSGSGASVEEETAYLAAFDQLKNGKYDAAISGFRSMLSRWPNGSYAANAYFWMGEAQIVKRDYQAALTSFQTLLSQYPTSPKAPDALLKIGLTQIDLKQEAEGRATLQRVVSTYPNSNAARLAQQRLSSSK